MINKDTRSWIAEILTIFFFLLHFIILDFYQFKVVARYQLLFQLTINKQINRIFYYTMVYTSKLIGLSLSLRDKLIRDHCSACFLVGFPIYWSLAFCPLLYSEVERRCGSSLIHSYPDRTRVCWETGHTSSSYIHPTSVCGQRTPCSFPMDGPPGRDPGIYCCTCWRTSRDPCTVGAQLCRR